LADFGGGDDAGGERRDGGEGERFAVEATANGRGEVADVETEFEGVGAEVPTEGVDDVELALGVSAEGSGADGVLVVGADGEVEERGGGVGEAGEDRFAGEEFGAAEGVLLIDLGGGGAAPVEAEIVREAGGDNLRGPDGDGLGFAG